MLSARGPTHCLDDNVKLPTPSPAPLTSFSPFGLGFPFPPTLTPSNPMPTPEPLVDAIPFVYCPLNRTIGRMTGELAALTGSGRGMVIGDERGRVIGDAKDG